jgi:homoserine dehydrogenase
MVPLDSVIAQVDGVTNAVAIESDILGELLMVGPGAGGNATASPCSATSPTSPRAGRAPSTVPVLGHPAKALEPYKQGADAEP